MSRPPFYNPQVVARILADVAAGVPKSSAFATNGICERTGYLWQRRYPEFAKALAEAQSQYELQQAITSKP